MLIRLEPLRRLLRATFAAAGCAEDEAARIAHYLTRANLTGHDSHGVIRTQRYIEWLRQGWVVAGRHARVVLDEGPLAILDAEHGFGQTVGPEAVAVGIEKARAHGIALVALRRAGHLGRIGDFAEQAIAAGLVSLHFVNAYGSILVAPYGGRSRRFSTNPVCIGVPTGDDAPFVLDFATALVAEGKVLVAQQGGPTVPVGALVGPDGELTDDPFVLYGPDRPGRSPDPKLGAGAMRAFGEHKGSGLALAVDLLAGALTGSGVTRDSGGRFHNGMLSIYLDPRALDTADGFARDVADYVAWIRSAEPIDHVAPVLIPGDKERRLAAARTAEGIPLPAEVWASILAAARLAGTDEREIEAAVNGAQAP